MKRLSAVGMLTLAALSVGSAYEVNDMEERQKRIDARRLRNQLAGGRGGGVRLFSKLKKKHPLAGLTKTERNDRKRRRRER